MLLFLLSCLIIATIYFKVTTPNEPVNDEYEPAQSFDIVMQIETTIFVLKTPSIYLVNLNRNNKYMFGYIYRTVKSFDAIGPVQRTMKEIALSKLNRAEIEAISNINKILKI